MLDRPHRLTEGGDFARVVRRGRRAGTPTMVLHLLDPPPAHDDTVGEVVGPPRVGFVVGKAVGAAVTRNRVKRRLRHLVRERVEQLPHGALLVVRALPPAAAESSTSLAADLDRALGRLARRREHS